MSNNSPNDINAARAEALRRHQQQQSGKKTDTTGTGEKARPQGLIPILSSWAHAVGEVVGKVTAPVVVPVVWIGKKLGKAAIWHWNSIAFKKEKDGTRHFSPVRLLGGVAIDAMVIAMMPFITMGAYYHATERTYNDVFIPNAGVFVNQQFLHPSQAGKIIAPRDEIFTVLGQHLDEKNKVEPIRFDIDSNLYFFYKRDGLRPDLMAARMVPTSPYGAMCTVQATGIYTRLPRILRANVVKWLDLRSEIVGLKGDCVQLDKVPDQYAHGDAPKLPEHYHAAKNYSVTLK